MRLFVTHRSAYRFSRPQTRLVQLLRLTPGNHVGQSVVAWAIDVDRDVRLRPARDGYSNETTMLYVDGPLDALTITVTGEVLTEDRAGMIAGAPEPLPPLYYLQPTTLTRADAAIAGFVRSLSLPRERLPRAHALAEAIHERLVLTPPDRTADQCAIARFAAGSADPQGATHLLIAAARAAGLPARYVAGHLFRPYEPAGHSAHGWAELHVEGFGWIGFDAYEGRCPQASYVRVATGLDHAQAAPIAGARIGGGTETLAVDVHVGTEPAAVD